MDILKELIIQEKNTKFISTIFAVFDYFVYLKESILNKSKKEPGVNTKYRGIIEGKRLRKKTTSNCSITFKSIKYEENSYDLSNSEHNYSKECVNNVIAICAHFILSLDFADFLFKMFQKKNDIDNKFGYIVYNIMEILNKQDLKKLTINPLFIDYIFNGESKRSPGVFNCNFYYAMISVVFNIPFDGINISNTKENILRIFVNKPSIKNRYLFKCLIKNIDLFDEDAKKEFLMNLKTLGKAENIIKELIKINDELIDLILGLFKYDDYLSEFISSLIFAIINDSDLSKKFIRFISRMNEEPLDKLKVINKILNILLDNPIKGDYNIQLGCLYLLYRIEDCILEFPKILSDPLLIKITAKFLYLLSDLNLLYISSPTLMQFDSDLITYYIITSSHNESLDKKKLREGGFVRIIVKILLLLMKFDKSPEFESMTLFRYYIFHIPYLQSKVESIANIVRHGEAKNATKDYNLINIAVKTNKKVLKQHNQYCETFDDRFSPNIKGIVNRNKIGRAHV